MSNEPTIQELVQTAVNNGASGAFVACLVTDRGGRHIAREVARKAVRSGERPHMGGFTSALWQGDVEKARRMADFASLDLMRQAGLIE